MTESSYLFVYGTLLKGSENLMSAFVKKKSEKVGRGSIRGRLFKVDFYPGAVFDPKSPIRIKGDILKLDQVEKVLEVLDGYEGFEEGDWENSLFIRKVLPVQKDSGETLYCWVYLFHQATEPYPEIDSGDFLAYELGRT
ncbi:MAG: gamma-glutamylcyclotransferase family protein [Bacteroidota bacterium]